MIFDSVIQLQSMTSGGEAAQGVLLVQVAQKLQRTTKNGKPYLEVQLADVGGSFSLKIWDNMPWYPDFSALEVNAGVAVSALWRSSEYGMEASDVALRPLSPEEEEQMLSGGRELRERQQHDWADICRLVRTVRDPRLAALCRELTVRLEGRFRRAAAARGFHHARRGGLVEHTAGVMRTADALCSAYPQLNRDLLLAGALFHDCGKMWENGYPEHGLTMPYSEPGELLGHIPLGIEVINKLWSTVCTEERRRAWEPLSPPSEQVRLHLLHLVAAHHGSLEFGSPVVPKTPEAYALNHADDLDAKMEMFRGAYATSPALAARIHQRKAPLPGNVVDPLPVVELPEGVLEAREDEPEAAYEAAGALPEPGFAPLLACAAELPEELLIPAEPEDGEQGEVCDCAAGEVPEPPLPLMAELLMQEELALLSEAPGQEAPRG